MNEATTEIQEAPFTVRHGMAIEVRGHGTPTITFNGRLRLMFDSQKSWRAFVDGLSEWMLDDVKDHGRQDHRTVRLIR